MPIEKEALDYLGEFLMINHRDKALSTLEKGINGDWKPNPFKVFKMCSKVFQASHKKKLLAGLNILLQARYMICYLLYTKKMFSKTVSTY